MSEPFGLQAASKKATVDLALPSCSLLYKYSSCKRVVIIVERYRNLRKRYKEKLHNNNGN